MRGCTGYRHRMELFLCRFAGRHSLYAVAYLIGSACHATAHNESLFPIIERLALIEPQCAQAAMLIRDYERQDAAIIVQIFYETIHAINLKDYSEEQLNTWAPEIPNAELWHSRMIQRCTIVGEEHGELIAFAELEHDGHLNMFYCRKEAVGRGVGSELYQAIEVKALELGHDCIFAEVSITARRFFEHCGFVVQLQQSVVRRGVELTNFKMQKQLPSRRRY